MYTSNYTAYIFFAAIITIAWWFDTDAKLGRKSSRVPSALVAIVATATIYSYSQGALFQRHNFVGGFRQVQFEITPEDRKRHKELYDLIAMIPPDASVAATETEAPHVSNRRFCFTLRFQYEDADYLLMALDEARGEPTSHQVIASAVQSGRYGYVTRRGAFALWKRGHNKDRNDQGMKLIGL